MSSNSIAEKEVSKDDYYVQTVNVSPAPQIQPNQKTFGSPAILGLVSLGTVILCVSVLTLTSKSVGPPSLVTVIATFYGGFGQIIVGVWEMFLGNTFSATVFATYGGFNFSYGALCLPRTGLAAAYTVDGVVGQQFYNAIGIYLAIWSSITFLLLLGSLRTTTPIVATLASTICMLACLSLNAFTGNPHVAIAGGAMGIVASFGAYYSAFSLCWTQQTTLSFICLPPLMLAPFNV